MLKFRWLLSCVLFVMVLKAQAASRQFVLVQVPASQAVHGTLQQYEYEANEWRKVGEQKAVVVGENGLVPQDEKREGDRRTPMGVFKLGPVFGFSPHSTYNMDYQPIQNTTVCVDDQHSRYYNQIVEQNISSMDWRSHEQMHVYSEYRHGSVIQYNHNERTPGKGSCIFLHIWPNPFEGTAGCIAMSEPDLLKLLTWLDVSKQPTIGVYTTLQYEAIRDELRLPSL